MGGVSDVGQGGSDGRASVRARLSLQAAVGERVRQVRSAQKMGQAECARGAGLDKSSMFRLEKGQQNVTIDVLARIALVLNVGLDELLAGVVPDPRLIEPDATD